MAIDNRFPQGFAMGTAVANVISILFIVVDLVKHEDD